MNLNKNDAKLFDGYYHVPIKEFGGGGIQARENAMQNKAAQNPNLQPLSFSGFPVTSTNQFVHSQINQPVRVAKQTFSKNPPHFSWIRIEN